MEIIIHESEIGSIGQITNIQNDSDFREYWGTAPKKIIAITHEEVRQANSAGLNYLEILVKKNILTPQTVQLSHEFKKIRPFPGQINLFPGQHNIEADRIIMGDGRLLNRRAFTDIAQTARLLGRGATFRFRFPLRKLLNLPPKQPVYWHYTLCQKGESISLLLFYNEFNVVGVPIAAIVGPPPVVAPNPGGVPLPGPPPSHGVKIPGGQQAQ